MCVSCRGEQRENKHGRAHVLHRAFGEDNGQHARSVTGQVWKSCWIATTVASRAQSSGATPDDVRRMWLLRHRAASCFVVGVANVGLVDAPCLLELEHSGQQRQIKQRVQELHKRDERVTSTGRSSHHVCEERERVPGKRFEKRWESWFWQKERVLG